MTTGSTTLDASGGSSPSQGEFVIWNDPANNGLLDSNVGELQPGETASIVIGLEQNIKIGRDSQFQLKTTNGNIIVGTVNVGQKSG